jgi:hypothetical protein
VTGAVADEASVDFAWGVHLLGKRARHAIGAATDCAVADARRNIGVVDHGHDPAGTIADVGLAVTCDLIDHGKTVRGVDQTACPVDARSGLALIVGADAIRGNRALHPSAGFSGTLPVGADVGTTLLAVGAVGTFSVALCRFLVLGRRSHRLLRQYASRRRANQSQHAPSRLPGGKPSRQFIESRSVHRSTLFARRNCLDETEVPTP